MKELIVNDTVVSVDHGTEEAKFLLSSGKILHVRLDGDCCSQSKFCPDEPAFHELVGKFITSVEERQSGREQEDRKNGFGVYESVRYHCLVFITPDEHVTLDWRNTSNGYYDGSVFVKILANKT